jgi:hypothetical protein
MAPLPGGFSAGKSGLCCDSFVRRLWAVRVCTSPVSRLLFFVGCLSLGPRKNNLTNYWALGPFVRPFTSLVDPGDIYPPQKGSLLANKKTKYWVQQKSKGPTEGTSGLEHRTVRCTPDSVWCTKGLQLKLVTFGKI